MVGNKFSFRKKIPQKKSNIAEKPRRASFRLEKHVFRSENILKIEGEPFDQMKKFRKKSRSAGKLL